MRVHPNKRLTLIRGLTIVRMDRLEIKQTLSYSITISEIRITAARNYRELQVYGICPGDLDSGPITHYVCLSWQRSNPI